MEYEMIITKREANPNYRPGMPTGYRDFNTDQEFLRVGVLSVVLTEEEFKIVKKAVLEIV